MWARSPAGVMQLSYIRLRIVQSHYHVVHRRGSAVTTKSSSTVLCAIPHITIARSPLCCLHHYFEGADMSKQAEHVKDHFEKHSTIDDMQHTAYKAGQAMVNEVQDEFKRGCTWIKNHPREDAEIVGGALIIGGVVLSLKDQRDGARAIEEGNQMLKGEQVVSQKLLFEKLGADSSVVTKIKLGNSTEEQFWIDAGSPKGQQLLNQRDGFGGFFKK
jgi:hypothetical protein